ncbi:GNAT family N-acetyltransferase [Leuconostoc gelidum]|uniref:GNAT family N-acetyltransferase n=1 Tax=Leuconostoc gelidum TaxID=1244 RepID=UPI001CC57390|nr:GNAT family N-acetyltransferase [Leuconostoc gelidum]
MNMLVYMRQAKNNDLVDIVAIIEAARLYLKQQGINQWQLGYPNQETILNDLNQKNGYVLIVEGQVAGYAAIVSGEEPSYTKIESGHWLNKATDYVAIHRLALSPLYRGQKLTQRFMTAILTYFFEQQVIDFRIDTHPKNMPMQAVIRDNGFTKQGIVRIDEGTNSSIRWAYQLLLK